MLVDISPLCLYHNVPMLLLDEAYRLFDCPLSCCNQSYDMRHGYYVMRNGVVEGATNKQPCTECSLFLYLAHRAANLGDSVWLCANDECPSNKSGDANRKSAGSHLYGAGNSPTLSLLTI
jgi:hypothetical protein